MASFEYRAGRPLRRLPLALQPRGATVGRDWVLHVRTATLALDLDGARGLPLPDPHRCPFAGTLVRAVSGRSYSLGSNECVTVTSIAWPAGVVAIVLFMRSRTYFVPSWNVATHRRSSRAFTKSKNARTRSVGRGW